MTEKEELSEELLEGWLRMSMSIWNRRLVTAMTYNESMVCNLLYKRFRTGGPPLTATELCARLQIRKPQMNVILNRMEQRGIISRSRSREDKRNVHITLTEEGLPVYEEAHSEILRLPRAVIEQLGEEKIRTFAETMKEVAACFQQVMSESRTAQVEERL